MAQPFQSGQRVRMNLSGMLYKGVGFHAAVTDALGQLVRKTAEDPPVWLVKFVFQFKGLEEIEVPEDRIRPA